MRIANKSKGNIITAMAFLFAVGCVAVIIFFDWALYWAYYKPLYTLFGSSLYLPFYLYIGGILIIIAFLLFVVFSPRERHENSYIVGKIVAGAFAVAVLFFAGRDVCRDIRFIENEGYLTIACNVRALRAVHHRKSTSYEIYSAEKRNGKIVDIEMDFYQYHELQQKYGEHGHEIITVYYLPHTERMLKYE
jgi:hypothetical protein